MSEWKEGWGEEGIVTGVEGCSGRKTEGWMEGWIWVEKQDGNDKLVKWVR